MSRSVRWLLVAVFLIFLSQSLAAVLIPIDATFSGLGATAVGFLVAAPHGVGLLMDIPFAAWSDLVGRRLPMMVGALAGMFAGVVFANGTAPMALALAALGFGISMSVATGSTLAFVTEAAPREDHTRIQGFNGSVQGLSTLVGASGAGLLITAVGARVSFWAMVVALALLGWIALGLRERLRSPARLVPSIGVLASRYTRVLELLRTEPAVRMAGGISLLYTLQLYPLQNSFVPLYLIAARQYSGIVVGVLLAIRSLVGVGLGVAYSRLLARYGMVKLILIGNILGLLGVLLVGVAATPILLGIPFALQGCGIAFGPATANLLITSATSEDERAIGFSANSSVARLGGLAFPLVLGTAIAIGGYGLLFAAAAFLGAIGLAAVLLTANSLTLWQRHGHANFNA